MRIISGETGDCKKGTGQQLQISYWKIIGHENVFYVSRKIKLTGLLWHCLKVEIQPKKNANPSSNNEYVGILSFLRKLEAAIQK